MTKQLIAIAPDNVSSVWHEIRDEVATIETPDGLIPEDVYFACKTNAAVLFFLMNEGKRVGWMVCRHIQPDLHIWQLKADAGYDVMTTFREELMSLARQAGAKKLTFGSTRKAWAKAAPEHGFKMRMIIYEATVDASSNNSAVAQ